MAGTSIIGLDRLKERYLLLFKDSDESYSKIKVENFIDKTTGLAYPPSPSQPAGVPGLMVPVPGDGLQYDQSTGQLSFQLGTDGITFVGFISTDYQQPDANLNYGDFYIVNQPQVTLNSADWRGIDENATVDYSLSVLIAGDGYRSDTGVVDGVGTADVPDGGTEPMFRLTITAGRIEDITCTVQGSGFSRDDVFSFVPNASGGGAGSGGYGRVLSTNVDGGIVDVEVAAAGQNYICDVNSAGVVSNVAVEGGSGTGMLADLSIDESGSVTSIAVKTQGYGYKDGEEVSFVGSKTGNNATATVVVSGGGDIVVTLGDRVFYTKEDKFVLVPDVTGATAILSLKPSESENAVFNFKEAPDSQNLELNIEEAKQNPDGSYSPGFISADDKEKLDNISVEAGQGTVVQINTVEEDNYLDTDTPVGIPPLGFNAISLLSETGDPKWDPNTIRYEATIADSQKILYAQDSSVLRPRVRGVVFTAEDFEIEREIDGSTLGSNVGPYVMTLEDHVRYMTQKNFSTLPKYEDLTYALGDLEIIGEDTMTEGGDLILSVQLNNTETPPNQLTYDFDVTDSNFALETVANNTPEVNSIYLVAKASTANETFIVNATASNGNETKTVAKTITIVGVPSTIGTIVGSPVDNPLVTRVGEQVDITWTPTGTVIDDTYQYEIDLDESYYTMTSNGSTVSITFHDFTATEYIENSSTGSATLTVKVYSQFATDTEESDGDGNFTSTTKEIIVLPSLSNVTVNNPNGTNLTAKVQETFTIGYESGAPEDEVTVTATTQRSVDDVILGKEDDWNMFDGDDNTFAEILGIYGDVEENEEAIEIVLNVNNHDVKFSDYEIFAKLKEQYRDIDGEDVLVENANLKVYFTDADEQRFLISELALTSDIESQLALAPPEIAEVPYVRSIIFECDYHVEIYGLQYQGDPTPYHKADVVEIDGLDVNVTFMKEGTNKVSGTVTYSDITFEYETDELTIS